MTGRTGKLHLALPLLAMLAACASHDGTGDADEATASTSFALEKVPADVHCLFVVLTGATRSVTRTFDTTPGAPATYFASGLPTGTVVVTAGAIPGTCHDSGTYTWVADPLTVTLAPATPQTITLKMRPAGQTSIAADFDADSWTVSTFVGKAGTAGTADGVGTAALFQSPWGLAVSGNHLYVQSWPGITRDVDLTTAATTTIANEGAASNSVVLGNALYVTDWWNNCIDQLDLGTKTWTVFAGSGVHGSAGWADGIGTAAAFDQPTGITTDGVFLYVADQSGTIRKITPWTAEVTTVAGVPFQYGNGDGAAADARFGALSALVYTNGYLAVADPTNHVIRRVSTFDFGAGRIAGNGILGNLDGTGSQPPSTAELGTPYGIAKDANGDLYFADSTYNVVRKIDHVWGTVMTIAGRPGVAGSTDGPGSVATFNDPLGVAVDGNGNIYVSEFDNHTVRKLAHH